MVGKQGGGCQRRRKGAGGCRPLEGTPEAGCWGMGRARPAQVLGLLPPASPVCVLRGDWGHLSVSSPGLEGFSRC